MPRTVALNRLKKLVGHEIGVSDFVTITQERIDRFADTTGDHQWIHCDVERARKESPYGGTIAHGFLTLSLFPDFVDGILQVQGAKMSINYGLDQVRFPSAVAPGAKVRARVEVLAVRDIQSGIQVKFGVTVECDSVSRPCCVAEWLVRYYF